MRDVLKFLQRRAAKKENPEKGFLRRKIPLLLMRETTPQDGVQKVAIVLADQFVLFSVRNPKKDKKLGREISRAAGSELNQVRAKVKISIPSMVDIRKVREL